ncbi:MAG: S1/P1 Nuclease [Bacteroidetes bacterium RIFCSPLOWO2_02_FULL_36_8]|nr:MAG: S1/P1 Nuclease [Bacteroidetes bacterium RIFCSPLOWO2_02_FULL_36_8]OFY70663.1 MAG: S1/P1 Nuclease [Bacteroidetes bacterium RIFCSPLOWO2_12_FULL_37_12]
MKKKKLLSYLLTIFISTSAFSWGFWAHQRINRLAVFTLPPEMTGFYKENIVFITEHATDPDDRRTAVKDEAPKHYIDLDIYGPNAFEVLPKKWKDAVEKYTEDTLQAYGIVPWHINYMRIQLTKAFKEKNVYRILRLSAEIGHYIADSHVPLHTTENYNGQKTNQHGIHGFWESRIPEMLGENFDLFTGKAEYISNPTDYVWETIKQSHACLDSVFGFEKNLNATFPEDRKYSFENRGNAVTKVYSKDYTKKYADMLSNQVDRRMRKSIGSVGNFWYTCWVDAGQPDLSSLLKYKFSEEEIKNIEQEKEEIKKGQVKFVDREK